MEPLTGIHPLHIPSVVDAIMSNLGVSDLLVARQICQQWNEEASKYLNNQAHLTIYRPEEVSQVHAVIKSSSMFKHPLVFPRINLETTLDPKPSSRSYQVFFQDFASKVKSLTLKQKWNTAFPLDLMTELQELTIYGNMNTTMGVFPASDIPYLPKLKRIKFNFEGRITETSTLQIFASNISQVVKAAPNVEQIVAPCKLDHRDETVDSYRDDTANHILLHILAADKDIHLQYLKRLEIDAKLLDYDLALLGRTAIKLPKLDTLRIALSPVATRNNLTYVLRKFSKQLKSLTILFSKTHGIRMSLTSFFMEESPLAQLESLSLKNYPASVSILGALKNLKKFRLEVRNIEDCFPSDRDEFFLQPATATPTTNSSPVLPSESCSHTNNNYSSSSNNGTNDQQPSSSSSSSSSCPTPPAHLDVSKLHGLTNFEYVHNKEGNKINLYSDKTHFNVARRICMRLPLIRVLKIDNMTEDSLTCIIKYLPLLEELHALGGFYSDQALIGATKADMKRDDFPRKRKLPYIGDLKYLHTLSVGTFAQNSSLCNTELLSSDCIYYGILDCKLLRKLTIGGETRAQSKFETNIRDDAIIALLSSKLNLTELKTVKCPFSCAGFNEILQMCKNRGIKYSINGYDGPVRPWEFVKNERLRKPVVVLKRLQYVTYFDKIQKQKNKYNNYSTTATSSSHASNPNPAALSALPSSPSPSLPEPEQDTDQSHNRYSNQSTNNCRGNNRRRMYSAKNGVSGSQKMSSKLKQKKNPIRQVMRRTVKKTVSTSSSKSKLSNSSSSSSSSRRTRTSPRLRALGQSQIKYELRQSVRRDHPRR